MRLPSFIAALALTAALAGCSSTPAVLTPDQAARQRKQLDSIRQDLTRIPTPTKSQYLAVKTLTTWQNPYLTIQGSMVTLHVMIADANTSDLGVGSMLRPVGARRQDLNVRASDLPAALNAVPDSAWPYGRVIALEEAHDAPQSVRPQLRRNLEATLKTLTDLGIVAYEWQEPATAAQ